MKVLNEIVMIGLTKQVRLRQKLEGRKEELAKWACWGREPWAERTRAKGLSQSGQDNGGRGSAVTGRGTEKQGWREQGPNGL